MSLKRTPLLTATPAAAAAEDVKLGAGISVDNKLQQQQQQTGSTGPPSCRLLGWTAAVARKQAP